jgi:Ni/Co efflux regulator RcnB
MQNQLVLHLELADGPVLTRERERARDRESERDRDRARDRDRESERERERERARDVGKGGGKADHAVVGKLAGGPVLTESERQRARE